jgi:hypothetical protein
MTNDLIARLADDLRPTPANTLRRRLGVATAIGIFFSALAMLSLLGVRSDLAQAVATASFWVKFTYTLALGLLGAWAASRIARPGETGRLPLSIAPVVVLLVGVLSIVEYEMAPPETRRALVMGATALVCPFCILGLSLPLLLAIMHFLRRMAPTHLTLGGLSAGLMAGGLGAWVYAFHCPESGLPFLTLWYSLGIAAVVLIGTLTGRWLLRW